MAEKITKVDEKTLMITVEQNSVITKEQLEAKVAQLTESLARVNSMLNEFTK